MGEFKIIQTTPNELSLLISESVKRELEILKKELEKHNFNDDLLSRDETCEYLSINRSTLWKYTKNGVLESKKIGNRIYYLKSEILKALNS